MMTCLRALLPSGLRQWAGAEAVADRFARWAPPIRDDPFGHFAEARARRPVQRVCLADGHPARVVLGYDAARHMLNVDPPDHTRLRRLVSLAFVPSRIAALEPAIRGIARNLLDEVDAIGPHAAVFGLGRRQG